MHTSTKALLALFTVGAATYGIYRHNRKKQAEESRKRRMENKQKMKKAA